MQQDGFWRDGAVSLRTIDKFNALITEMQRAQG